MVKATLALLGEVIRTELGDPDFRRIESIRRRMTSLRKANPSDTEKALRRTLMELKALKPEAQLNIGRAFTLMLELMNACENAYRTYRLKNRSFSVPEHKPEKIIYVLTAHPTESRSPETVLILQRIRSVITVAFSTGFSENAPTLSHLIVLAWRVSIVRNTAPTVADEAEHVYSLVLREEILDALLDCNQSGAGIPVYLRSWVGGDKDGHPGVDEKTLFQSLGLSRKPLVQYLQHKLQQISETLALLAADGPEMELKALCADARNSLIDLMELRTGDGLRVRSFHQRLEILKEAYLRILHSPHPLLQHLLTFLEVFPGIVIPLELRESAEIISEATLPSELAIYRMLETVRSISNGGDPRWYARELILSMTRSAKQLQQAAALVKKVYGEVQLPIVPLFEQAADLKNAFQIISEFINDPQMQKSIIESWNKTVEVMVGYSDSAKESGMLPSRVAISQALFELDSKIHDIKLVFFHGSGGSVDRGGGSLEEQIRWWPKSALRVYKSTIQGEMIDRLFSSTEILEGQVQRFSEEAGSLLETDKKKDKKRNKKETIVTHPTSLIEFSQLVEIEYRRKTTSPEFLKLIERATPYRFLNVLKMGSRPPARQSSTFEPVSLKSLRAIPWVLCWTQTRVLFPTWWGIGTAWSQLTAQKQDSLKKAFRQDPLLQSFVKLLGFTLAKVELPVWMLYLSPPSLTEQEADLTLKEFYREFNSAKQFVRSLSGSEKLLWYRPWLNTSIRLRSPMIHPLNLLQIIAFERQDPSLIRLTVTGIASGMMTTG